MSPAKVLAPGACSRGVVRASCQPATRRRRYGHFRLLAKYRAPIRADESLQDVPITECTLAEYVDYCFAVEAADPNMDESLAARYPRFYANGWEAFSVVPGLWEQIALPPSLQDHTYLLRQEVEKAQAAIITGGKVEIDPAQQTRNVEAFHRRMTKVFLGVAGSITRLHFDNDGAHAWLSLVRGRKLLIAFAPEDSEFLYAFGPGGTQSPVDPLAPDLGRYPLYEKATPHVAVVDEGEAIILPSGWWHYALALSPTVMVMRNFWNATNVRPFCEARRAELERTARRVAELSAAMKKDRDRGGSPPDTQT